MNKKQVLEYINKYFLYHRSNSKNIKNFNLSNEIKLINGKTIKSYGVYFNFDKYLYKNKGEYIYNCIVNIKNPFITNDQFFSAIIDLDKKKDLYKKGYDSVVLVSKNEIREVVCFTNSQIKIESIIKD